MCGILGSFLLFSGTTLLSALLVKINLTLPEIHILNVIYVRAPLALGIQAEFGVCWVASWCAGCMQIALEISCPICTAIM